MALKKSIVKTVDGFEGTLSVTDAYWKIISVSGSKDQLDVTVQATSDDKQVDSFSAYFVPSVAEDSENFIRQAYMYLKTLPQFDGAEDC